MFTFRHHHKNRLFRNRNHVVCVQSGVDHKATEMTESQEIPAVWDDMGRGKLALQLFSSHGSSRRPSFHEYLTSNQMKEIPWDGNFVGVAVVTMTFDQSLWLISSLYYSQHRDI